KGHVAGRLAGVLEETGAGHGVVGLLRLAAGDPAAAYPHLLAAAFAARNRSAMGEAFELAGAALEAATAGLADPNDLGHLHLIRGQHLRAAGRSAEAAAELDTAISRLRGEDRIDALGYAAAVADDRRRPQVAERLLAAAEWEAARLGALAQPGSPYTFRARALNRLGFAEQPDAAPANRTQWLSLRGAPPRQLATGENNPPGAAFRPGLAAQAEVKFTHPRDTAPADDDAGRADKDAWRARALFASGHPDAALEAADAARHLADRAEV